jgi:hypothetical protein
MNNKELKGTEQIRKVRQCQIVNERKGKENKGEQ